MDVRFHPTLFPKVGHRNQEPPGRSQELLRKLLRIRYVLKNLKARAEVEALLRPKGKKV